MTSPIFDATFKTGRFREEKPMTDTPKAGLVDRVQSEIENFRVHQTPAGQIDFRSLAVEVVRVFRDYIGDETKKPDVRDNEQPSEGHGWE